MDLRTAHYADGLRSFSGGLCMPPLKRSGSAKNYKAAVADGGSATSEPEGNICMNTDFVIQTI